MRYIGPLRRIPPRGLEVSLTKSDSAWSDGMAAWETLVTGSQDLVERVSDWMQSPAKLGTGYAVTRKAFQEFDPNHPVPQPIGPIRKRAQLVDGAGLTLQPQDVGVGISQMVPVIVASLRKQEGVLGIEQPELHVHPAIQVGMGDLFIKAAAGDEDKLTSGKTLLIETHSEHIMLRLLRRVREQTEGEVPPGVLGLTPDDLSVIYVESSVEGVRFRPLRVSPDGDFVDRWPHGFFAERAEELF
jgi:predicted ATPase